MAIAPKLPPWDREMICGAQDSTARKLRLQHSMAARSMIRVADKDDAQRGPMKHAGCRMVVGTGVCRCEGRLGECAKRCLNVRRPRWLQANIDSCVKQRDGSFSYAHPSRFRGVQLCSLLVCALLQV